MIEIIKEKKHWTQELALTKNSDFYHTFDYHHLSKNSDEHPILIKYTYLTNSILLPLLIRDIPNTIYKDATSVYGYAGPLIVNRNHTFSLNSFHKELFSYFNKNKIISLFSRLHPFFEEEEAMLTNLGSVNSLGKVVYINLNNTIEEQRAKYNRRLKTYINKARRQCSVIKGNIKDHLETFIELYHDNMKRVNADKHYFFPYEYFEGFFTSDDLDSELLLCINNKDQEIIAGAIFIKTNNIVQYHLSGMDLNWSHVNPIKLIIDTMRIWATEQGYQYLNLGGGKGSSEDSLFRFKNGFSKDLHTFKIWKYIVNHKIYNDLTKANLLNQSKPESVSFFPAYRYKVKQNIIEKV
jgi:hypothetical protein